MKIEYLWFQMFRYMSLVVFLCISGQFQLIQPHPQPQQLSRCSAVVRIISLLSGIGVKSCPSLPMSYQGNHLSTLLQGLDYQKYTNPIFPEIKLLFEAIADQ